MKRRIFGAVLAVIGTVSLVFAVGLPLYAVPNASQLPYDMQPCPKDPKATATKGCLKPSIAEAKNAKFLQIKVDDTGLSLEVRTGDLRTMVEILPQAQLTADQQASGALSSDAIVWDGYQTVTWIQTGEVISASSTELALDRKSGAGVNWPGQWINESGSKDTEIRYSDQVYKFPFGTEQRDYKMYDTNLRAATKAVYKGTETIAGVETYHFVAEIPATAVPTAEGSLHALLGRFAPSATSGKVTYANTQEVWVDPVTGAFIKIRQQPKKMLVPDTGDQVVLLQAEFIYTDETINNSAQSAKDNGSLIKLAGLYAPIALGVLGLLLLAVGFLMARAKEERANSF